MSSNLSRHSALGLGAAVATGAALATGTPAEAALRGPAQIKATYLRQKAKAGGT